MHKTIHHVCLSVRGVLHESDRDMQRLLNSVMIDGKKPQTVGDLREAFADQLALGHEVLPFGDPCEGFDYAGRGCPGHRVEGEASDG